jgi:hypothetical protein
MGAACRPMETYEDAVKAKFAERFYPQAESCTHKRGAGALRKGRDAPKDVAAAVGGYSDRASYALAREAASWFAHQGCRNRPRVGRRRS